MHTGQHYDEAMSDGQILATSLPRPRHNLGSARARAKQQLDLARERLEELIAPSARRGDRARRHQRHALRRARRGCGRRAARARRGGPALLPRGHARGAQPHRDRPALRRCSARPRRARGATSQAKACAGEIHVTGDPLCDMLESWRARVRPAGDGDYLLATVHRNYNTDTPERLGAVLACLARSPLPVVMPLHPRTRAAIDGWGLAVPANVELIEPVPYTRMLELERGAARDRHRLRRRPARGLPVGRALRHPARGDRVDRHRRGGLEHACGRRPRRVRGRARRPLPQRAPPDLRRWPCRAADRPGGHRRPGARTSRPAAGQWKLAAGASGRRMAAALAEARIENRHDETEGARTWTSWASD